MIPVLESEVKIVTWKRKLLYFVLENGLGFDKTSMLGTLFRYSNRPRGSTWSRKWTDLLRSSNIHNVCYGYSMKAISNNKMLKTVLAAWMGTSICTTCPKICDVIRMDGRILLEKISRKSRAKVSYTRLHFLDNRFWKYVKYTLIDRQFYVSRRFKWCSWDLTHTHRIELWIQGVTEIGEILSFRDTTDTFCSFILLRSLSRRAKNPFLLSFSYILKLENIIVKRYDEIRKIDHCTSRINEL